jgi:hypothetical protein
MRREPENGDVQVAGTSLLSLMFGRLWWAGGEARPPWLFVGFPDISSGRWESGKPAFGFPLFHRPRRRRCGNVEISPAVGEISKGLVERVGSLLLAFHAFHSPGISTVLLPQRVVRQRANKVSFAFCIRRAASVSLRASDCPFSIPAVIPSFKYSVHPFMEVSFS